MAQVNTAVVIANHNYGKWIEGAIDSVAAGTVLPKICAVTDDGSSDGSHQKILEKLTDSTGNKILSLMDGIAYQAVSQGYESMVGGFWKGTPLYIRLHKHREARGPSAARNTAIEACLKDVDSIAILDADDEFYPTKLETLRAAWQSAPDLIGIVYGDYDTVDAGGVMIREFKPVYSREHLLRECIIHSGSLISKQALEYAGLYDPDLRTCEDFDLWLRATEKFLAYHVPQALTLVRVGSHQSSATVPQERWHRDYQRVFEKLRERACQQPS